MKAQQAVLNALFELRQGDDAGRGVVHDAAGLEPGVFADLDDAGLVMDMLPACEVDEEDMSGIFGGIGDDHPQVGIFSDEEERLSGLHRNAPGRSWSVADSAAASLSSMSLRGSMSKASRTSSKGMRLELPLAGRFFCHSGNEWV